MDGRQFDALSRSLASASTRRGIVHILSTLPVFGLLLALLDEQADAKRRQKSRQKPARKAAQAEHHNRGQGHHKKSKKNSSGKKQHKRKCKPKSAARTCVGRCGQVANKCGPIVDCGPCDCGPCPACQICDATTGQCWANPAFVGQDCGSPGQVCQESGVCACDAGSCLEGQHCNGIACVCDATSCPNGCCDSNRVCRTNVDEACGTGGGVCNQCEDQCVDGACTCATACPACQSCNSETGLCRPDLTTDGDTCGAGRRCQGGQCVCDATSCPNGCCDGNVCRIQNASACGTGGGTCTPCVTPGQACEGGACCASAGSVATVNAPCCAGLTLCANGVCRANCCAGVTCTSDDACKDPGVCDPSTGLCSAPTRKGNGAPCDDGDPCLSGSTCQGGICGGGTTICTNPPECYTTAGATCSAGNCTYQPSAVDTPCGSVPCGRCDGSGTCGGCPDKHECQNGSCCGLSGATCGSASDCCPCDGCDCSSLQHVCFQSDIG